MMSKPDRDPNGAAVRFCGVCRTSLNRRSVDGGPLRWEHTAAAEHRFRLQPHDPVPVPMIEFTEVNALCDFCGARHVSFTFEFDADIRVIVETDEEYQDNWMGRRWSACDDCAHLIQAKQLVPLVRRVARAMVAQHPGALDRVDVAADIYPMYKALLDLPFNWITLG